MRLICHDRWRLEARGEWIPTRLCTVRLRFVRYGSDDFRSRCSVSRSDGADLAPEDEHEDRLSPVCGHGTGGAYHEAPLMKKPVAWTMTEAEWIAERKAVFALYRNGAGKRR